ncbi:MAG: hypothetical protein L3J47_00375 [Sulfurovum sp.]|nr:hypothetical protein [Sulfurovum sp.]
MRYITIPPPVLLGKDKGANVTQTFQEWLASNPLNAKAFGENGKTLRVSLSLEGRFSDKEEGERVPLSDDEWDLLSEAAETPDGSFNVPIAKLFLPFMDAIQEAEKD